jgi:hypothetical protein
MPTRMLEVRFDAERILPLAALLPVEVRINNDVLDSLLMSLQ